MKTKLLDTLTFSEKRENLLVLLKDGPKTLEDIRTNLNVTSSGVIPQIRKLEEQNLVKKEGKSYTLTDMGEIITSVFVPLIKTIEIFEKYEDFLINHDIEAIPQHLLKRIYELGNCHLVENDISEIYEPHMNFFEALSKSKKVMGIAPIFHYSYPPFFLKLAQNGVEVSLLLTHDVFEKIKKEYMPMLDEYLSLQNASLYVSDEKIKLASAVSDSFFSISLFFKNGGYDSQKDLVSEDDSAVKWGRELFDHFMLKSKRVKSL
jgi:predicted transcriptional regulator